MNVNPRYLCKFLLTVLLLNQRPRETLGFDTPANKLRGRRELQAHVALDGRELAVPQEEFRLIGERIVPALG